MRIRRFSLGLTALAFAGLTACVPRSEPPPPTPPPPPAPPPAPPAPPPAPPPADWSVAPLSPGDWSHAGNQASFGGDFAVRCDGGRIALARTGNGSGQRLTIRTTYGERTLPASNGGGRIVATVAASDALLDQIAFSRGRFLVQADGLPALIVPAWPEPARVIEDCRG